MPQTVTGTGVFECVLPGLNPGSTYYFRARAVGDGYQLWIRGELHHSDSPSFDLCRRATSLTSDSATLNADLTSLGTANCVNVYFQFSTYPGLYDGQTMAVSAATPGAVSSHVTGLLPGTTYYFRGVAEGVHGVAYGAEGSFATPAIPPSMVIGDPSEIAEAAATLGVNLVDLGSGEAAAISSCGEQLQAVPT